MNNEELRKEAAEKLADKHYGNTPGVLSKNIFKHGFDKCAEWEAERDKWISVDDKPNYGQYLVWNPNLTSENKTERAYFASYNNQWMNDCHDIIHPTHYQGLPTPPKASK